jgi:putative DNA primase/helicase
MSAAPVPVSPNAMLEAALSYARSGFPVFPLYGISGGRCSCRKADCGSAGKHPRTSRGHQDASTDEAVIRGWWERWPDANIGVPTGARTGFIVLDVDPDHGGTESLRQLCEAHGDLPETAEAITGGGGCHLLFKLPGEEIRNSASKLAPGLDIRGEGGYIVVAPSTHRSGANYTWAPGKSICDTPIAAMPEWLLSLLRQRRNVVPLNGDRGDVIPEGRRNEALASFAGTMRRKGLREEEIAAALLEINARRCDSPLEEGEVRHIARSIARYSVDDFLALTDMGNAQRLVIRHGHDLRYCMTHKRWYVWDGRRWCPDETGEVERRAKDTARSILEEAARHEADEASKVAKWALKSQQRERLEAMIALARSELPVRANELDRSRWLLNFENGTIDLRKGELLPHDRDHLITKLVNIKLDSDARCPRWEKFVSEIMGLNDELVNFLQRVIGYCLTSETVEQCFFLLHGPGANGKSTFLEIAHDLLGDYARKAEFSTLLAKERDGVRNDVAALRGARLVSSVEPERGRRLNESLIKELTGGDNITARFLYGEFFEFQPEFKLLLAANHKPEIRGVDEGIWRRVILIPFEVVIPREKRNKNLLSELRSELPGILNWALAGCLEWQKTGLRAPPEVIAATAGYREEMDFIGDFIDAYLAKDPNCFVSAGGLKRAYVDWCTQNGADEIKGRTLAAMMKERGYTSKTQRVNGKPAKVWVGCRLTADFKF